MKKGKFNFVKPALFTALCFSVLVGVSILHGCDIGTSSYQAGSEKPAEKPVDDNSSKFSDEAVVVNEMHKYKSAVVLFVDASDVNTDITGNVLQLDSGKNADPSVIVEPADIKETDLFVITNGGGLLLHYVPQNLLDGGQTTEQAADEADVERENADMGIITLNFRKEKVSRTLDITVRLDKKSNTKPDVAGTVKPGDTYLLYGYDVINSRYFNSEDVKRNNPVLDLGKVNAYNKIASKIETLSDNIAGAGESAKEMNEKLNVKANVGYKGALFSGGISAGFTTAYNSSNVNKFAMLRGIYREKDEWLEGVSAAELKKLVTNEFKNDIERMDAKQFLSTYGTHLITRAYWGASVEMYFSYTGTKYSGNDQLTAAVNASYAGFSAGASTEYDTAKTELSNKSEFHAHIKGGVNATWNSLDGMNDPIHGLGAWVAKLDSLNATLCGVPFEMNKNAMFPVWEIVNEFNPAKAKAVEAEFYNQINTAESNLLGLKGTPASAPAKPEPRWRTVITAIDAATMDKGTPPSGWKVVKNKLRYGASTDADDPLNANNGAGGDKARIFFKTENIDVVNNKKAMITEIALWNDSKPPDGGWQIVKYNLNSGTKKGEAIYLIYRKAGAGDNVGFSDIQAYDEKGDSTATPAGHFGWINLYGSALKYNLNAGAGGHYIYLMRVLADL